MWVCACVCLWLCLWVCVSVYLCLYVCLTHKVVPAAEVTKTMLSGEKFNSSRSIVVRFFEDNLLCVVLPINLYILVFLFMMSVVFTNLIWWTHPIGPWHYCSSIIEPSSARLLRRATRPFVDLLRNPAFQQSPGLFLFLPAPHLCSFRENYQISFNKYN